MASIGQKLVKDLFAAIKERNWDKLDNMIHPAFQSVHHDGARNRGQFVAVQRKVDR